MPISTSYKEFAKVRALLLEVEKWEKYKEEMEASQDEKESAKWLSNCSHHCSITGTKLSQKLGQKTLMEQLWRVPGEN